MPPRISGNPALEPRRIERPAPPRRDEEGRRPEGDEGASQHIEPSPEMSADSARLAKIHSLDVDLREGVETISMLQAEEMALTTALSAPTDESNPQTSAAKMQALSSSRDHVRTDLKAAIEAVEGRVSGVRDDRGGFEPDQITDQIRSLAGPALAAQAGQVGASAIELLQ